jgi:DNA repair protein RecO (recombination protein O)
VEDLAFVSPKSGRAVSRGGAGEYRDRLFPLPPFMIRGGDASWEEIVQGFRLTGHFLERDLPIERQADLLAARERLVDRLKRVFQ